MVECWMCGSEVIFEGGELTKHCSGCGVEVDITNQANKEVKVEDLGKWAKENAKFIKIPDGGSYEGIYNGYKTGVNMNGDPAIIYKIDDKEFKSSSTVLANTIAKIEKGTQIKISREGEGLQTKWKVEVL